MITVPKELINEVLQPKVPVLHDGSITELSSGPTVEWKVSTGESHAVIGYEGTCAYKFMSLCKIWTTKFQTERYWISSEYNEYGLGFGEFETHGRAQVQRLGVVHTEDCDTEYEAVIKCAIWVYEYLKNEGYIK